MKNLSNIEHELDIVTKQYVDNAADTKVDKIEGKQLSTNDFSNEDKEKLSSLENYILPMASADALGGIKIGNNLNIDENGVLTSKEPFMVYEGNLDSIHLINQNLKQSSNFNTAIHILDKLLNWTHSLEDSYILTKNHDIDYINNTLNEYIQGYILSDSDCSTYTASYIITMGICTSSGGHINVSESFSPIRYDNSSYSSMYRYTSSYNRGILLINLWGKYLKVTFKFNSSGLNTVIYTIIEDSYTLPMATTETLGGVKIGNDLTIDENGILNIDNINYTKIENKPTLNGITIEGDKVGADYGINDTNVYYGTEEPTAENVVMWVDPSGAPVSVLTTDNTIEYTPTEDYNPATKKYVDEHGVNTDEIYAMDNYELLTLEQEDLSQEIKSSVYGQLDSTSSASTWTGHIVGKQDPATWSFSLYSTRTLAINNSTVQTQNNIWSVVDGDATLTMAGINTALARSSYNSSYALKNMVHKTTTTNFGWDFKKSTTFTFKYRISLTESSNFTAATAVLKGSNDNSTWTTLSNLSMTNADLTYTATTPYRYILLSITQTNNSGTTASGISSKWTIYYMRFTQVTDTLVQFNNKFTALNDFVVQNIKRVQIPAYENVNQVISNSINGIPLSVIVPPQQKTTIEYNNNQLNIHSGINVIKKGSVSMSSSKTTTLTCPEARMAFVYASFTNEIPHWFPLFRDGLVTTGYTGSSTSTSYTFSFSQEGILTITSGSSASARTIDYAFI